jgi:hypothetical protein
MMKVRFEINSRSVTPRNIKDALEQDILRQVEENLRQRIGTIRDPETGEFPTIVVTGKSLDQLRVEAEGSPALLVLIKERLGPTGEDEVEQDPVPEAPRAFLSYAWEDRVLAEKIADAMQANGIETWWAQWCIGPGDSLRLKIEEGLGDCTHFIVLLTPTSMGKPWVNQEMDAGFMRKLKSLCTFIALRHGLPADRLSPFLSGMLSPEVVDPDRDIAQLINDIHGVTRKPPLGKPPAAVTEARKAQTGYSAAASAIAKVLVERSETATFADQQLSLAELEEVTGLSQNDVEDALHELSSLVRMSSDLVLPEDELFVRFDRFWTDWDTAEDARRLATDLMNEKEFPRTLPEIGARYGWEARRLNPVVAYLINRKIVRLRDFQLQAGVQSLRGARPRLGLGQGGTLSGDIVGERGGIHSCNGPRT